MKHRASYTCVFATSLNLYIEEVSTYLATTYFTMRAPRFKRKKVKSLRILARKVLGLTICVLWLLAFFSTQKEEDALYDKASNNSLFIPKMDPSLEKKINAILRVRGAINYIRKNLSMKKYYISTYFCRPTDQAILKILPQVNASMHQVHPDQQRNLPPMM